MGRKTTPFTIAELRAIAEEARDMGDRDGGQYLAEGARIMQRRQAEAAATRPLTRSTSSNARWMYVANIGLDG
jgi:hypothetical protein